MNCSDPSPVAGVTFSPFSDTTEGANISFNCGPGLELQREDVSVCSSNGSWVPDPAHRICSLSEFKFINFYNFIHSILDCGQPVLSPNVSAVSTTGTTEGDTVTLQCEDVLFPPSPINITCTRSGVWTPDPAELVCTVISGKLAKDLLMELHTHINQNHAHYNYTKRFDQKYCRH